MLELGIYDVIDGQIFGISAVQLNFDLTQFAMKAVFLFFVVSQFP